MDRSLKCSLRRPAFRLQTRWLVGMMALLLVLSVTPPLSKRMTYLEQPAWPSAALDYIEQKEIAGRFYCHPDFGSYLTWRLGDKVKVYSDTRGFYFPPEILVDCQLIAQFSSSWHARLQRVLDDYEPEYFLLEAEGPRGKFWRRLEPHVEPLFADEISALVTAEQVREAVEQLQAQTASK